ncbi:DUF1858 domain-containing protein [Nitratireductor pacificus]|uniref:DUF1858 domain-containing protein n=1 Tax=Nitratireductor pacificus pht-3B TaxID=391937 RepID=K2LNE5_9HYPH|nr:DUF1858 domain-containing protein [Nitratireductor pacificus]EKF19284.1 hypothetical protein NA2_09141 [Nitratireductor pacificus pht-3B]
MKSKVTEDMSMDEIMRRWPATIPVILRHRMLCVGCPIAPFHTMADACREHDIDGSAFRDAIRRAIGAGDGPA